MRMMVWWMSNVKAQTRGVKTVIVSFLLCNPKEPGQQEAAG